MSRRRISASALAVLATLTLAVGCSSSDSSDADRADDKTTTTAAAGSGDTTDTTAADGGGDDEPTTTGGGSGGDDIELTGDFCEMALQLETVGDELFGEDTTDTSPESLLASLKELFRTLDSVYGQLNQDPPAEIAEDIAVLAEFAATNYAEVKDLTSYEDATAIAQSAFGEESDSDEFTAASDRIGVYVEEECGITQE